MTDPTGPRPTGEAGETAARRTRMAWRRTVLATAVVAILAGRLAVERGASGTVAAVPALATLGWLTVFAAGHRRIRQLAAYPSATRRPLLWLVAAMVCGYTMIGVLLALPPN